MRPLAIITIVSKIVPVPVMIILAYSYHSVWALVAGAVISQIVASVASHVFVAGDRMRLGWHAEAARSLLADGRWIALSSANNVLTSQGDRLILSVLMSTSQLGFYSIAWLLLESFRALLHRLHSGLTLPVMSELYRTRPEMAAIQYYRYRRPIEAAAFTVAGMLWVFGPTLVNILYSDRYSDAGDILQILSISLLSIPFSMIVDRFLAYNELRIYGTLSIVNSVSFIIAVLGGHAIAGVQGVIWGIVLFRWPQVVWATGLAYRRNWIRPLHEIVMLPLFGEGLLLGYASERAMELVSWRLP